MGRRPAARITGGAPPTPQLFEIGAGHASLLFQLVQRTGLQLLITLDTDIAPRQRPHPGVRLCVAGRTSHQQHIQLVINDREDHYVHCCERPQELGRTFC